MDEAPWRDSAACRGMDVNLFFPVRETMATTAYPLSICAKCPVTEPCLEEAMQTPMSSDYGIRGGVRRDGRRLLRRQRGTPRPLQRNRLVLGGARHILALNKRGQPVKHGTRWTYMQGCHCDPCTDAESDYQRVRDQERKAQ